MMMDAGLGPLWVPMDQAELDAVPMVDSRSYAGAGSPRYVNAAEDIRAGLLDLMRLDAGAGRTSEVARLLLMWAAFVDTKRLCSFDEDRWSLISVLEEACRAEGVEPQKYDHAVLSAFFERLEQAWVTLWTLRDDDDGSRAQLEDIAAFFEKSSGELLDVLAL